MTDTGYPISGHFELYADTHESIRHRFGTDADVDRFGVFGWGPDRSLHAVSRQDDGRYPVVYLGSEGQNNFVLAANMVDLAINATGREGTSGANGGVPDTHTLRSHTHGWRTFMDALPLRRRNGNRGDLPTIPNSWDETWNCAAREPDSRRDCVSRPLTVSQSMYH
jgi:hypothetical protein